MLMRIFTILVFCFIQTSNADYLKVYIMKSNFNLNWASPHDYMNELLAASLSNNDVPNEGQIAIEIESEKPNQFGFKHILTSFRPKKFESSLQTVFSHKGFQSFFEEKESYLASAKETKNTLQKAIGNGRVAVIKLELFERQTKKLIKFLDKWISYGRFRNLKWNQALTNSDAISDTELASYLLNEAYSNKFPFTSWTNQILIPTNLIGSKDNKVKVKTLLDQSNHWANSNEPHQLYQFIDINRMYNYVLKHSPHLHTLVLYNVDDVEIDEPALKLKEIKYTNSKMDPKLQEQIWQSISID